MGLGKNLRHDGMTLRGLLINYFFGAKSRTGIPGRVIFHWGWYLVLVGLNLAVVRGLPLLMGKGCVRIYRKFRGNFRTPKFQQNIFVTLPPKPPHTVLSQIFRTPAIKFELFLYPYIGCK